MNIPDAHERRTTCTFEAFPGWVARFGTFRGQLVRPGKANSLAKCQLRLGYDSYPGSYSCEPFIDLLLPIGNLRSFARYLAIFSLIWVSVTFPAVPLIVDRNPLLGGGTASPLGGHFDTL